MAVEKQQYVPLPAVNVSGEVMHIQREGVPEALDAFLTAQEPSGALLGYAGYIVGEFTDDDGNRLIHVSPLGYKAQQPNDDGADNQGSGGPIIEGSAGQDSGKGV